MFRQLTLFVLILLAPITSTIASAADFYVEVPADAAQLFTLMETITTPAGAVTDEATYLKFVTRNSSPEVEIRSITRPDRPPVLLSGAIPITGTMTDPSDPLNPATDSILLTREVDDPDYKVYQLEILYKTGQTVNTDDPPVPTAEQWQITIRQHASDPHEYFGFSGATEAEVTRPRLVIREPINFGQVQRNVSTDHAPIRPVDIRNLGTANAIPSSATITTNPQNFFAAPVTNIGLLKPGISVKNDFATSTGLWVTTSPTSLDNETNGQLSIAYTDVADSSFGPATTTLAADGVNLFMHILMDVSGSMSWRPDGSRPAPVDEQRLSYATKALEGILEWLPRFSDNQAFVGFGSFPNRATNSNDPLESIDRITDVQKAAIALDVAALYADGPTPMESGIRVALTDMQTNEPNDDDCLGAGTCDFKKAILMLSDGAEGNPVPSDARSTIDLLKNEAVHMYTIGYGPACPLSDTDCAVDLSTNYDRELLQYLATKTDGAFIEANNPDALTNLDSATPVEAFRLKNAFKQAIAPLLGLQMVEDPIETIRRSQTKSHEACIDERAYGATFLVDWDRRVNQGIELVLAAPTGETYTKNSSGVDYFESDNHAMFVLQGNLIRAGKGKGQWTINVTGGQSIPTNSDTLYSVSVLAQSPIIAEPKIDVLWVGGEMLAELSLVGLPLQAVGDLNVTLNYSRPTKSLEKYLAQPVDSKLLQQFDSSGQFIYSGLNVGSRKMAKQVAATDGHVPINPNRELTSIRQIKAAALREAGLVYKPAIEQGSVKLKRSGDKYVANLDHVALDGVYNFYFEIDSGTERRNCVQREVAVSQYAGIQINSALLTGAVEWLALDRELFFDQALYEELSSDIPAGKIRSVARLRPMFDDIPWGIGKSEQISTEISGGERIRSIIDDLTGSYYQVVEHARSDQPSIQFAIGGVTGDPISAPKIADDPPWVLIILVLIVLVVVAFHMLRRT